MKKLKLHTLILTLLLATSLCAQNTFEPQIEWTKKQHMVRKQDLLNRYVYLTGNEKEFFFVYYTVAMNGMGGEGVGHIYFVKMDMVTGEPKYLRLEHKTGDYERKAQHVLAHDDKIYAFSSYQNKKEKKHYIFVETLNKETLDYNNDVRKIGEISYGDDIKGSKLDNFALTTSPNKDLNLLSYSIVNGDKITNFGLLVLHKDMSEMWHSESPFPTVEGKDISLTNYTLDNDGNVYVAQNRYDKKDKKWELYLTYFPAYNKGESVVREMELDNNTHSISEKIIANNVGDIICTGFYTNPNRYSALGMYSYIYSPGLKDIKMKDIKEFSDEFITMGMSEKDIEKMVKNKDKGKDFDEGFTYTYDAKLNKKDGGYTMTFEKYKLQIQSVRNGPDKRTIYYHNYNDIVAATYNADGSIRWVQKIPKRQRFTGLDRHYGSYKTWIDNNDNIKFIYNEEAKKDKYQPIIVSLDQEGKISITELFKKADKDVRKTFSPLLTEKLDNNKFMLGRVEIGMFKGTQMLWGITELK